MALDWDKLRLFHAVVEAGSLTDAARLLGMSQPALSRQIRTLEEQAGASLFYRHARGIALTYEGERLSRATSGFADRIEAAEREMAESRGVAKGVLSVTTTVSFGSLWLVPHLPHFYERYPALRLQLLLSDEELDLNTRQAEVAIRFKQPRQGDLIQRPLVRVQHNIYASRNYLALHGEPHSVEELGKHPLIVYGPHAPSPIRDVNWVLKLSKADMVKKPLLTINNIYGIMKALRASLGIAALPDYVARHEPDLVHILPEVKGPNFQTYFVYPAELKNSLRLQAFRDFLFDEIADFPRAS
ncbi:MAG: LysR family transcriptional regulator [Pseudomonadota bacterium]